MKLIADYGRVDIEAPHMHHHRAVWTFGTGYCELSHDSHRILAFLHRGSTLTYNDQGWPFVTGITHSDYFRVPTTDSWDEVKEAALAFLMELYL